MPPTNSRRNRRQKIRERLAKAREDAQLVGLVETVPAGAVRDERVNPTVQSEQQFPQLIETAIKRGWATPENKKPEIIDGLISEFETTDDPHLKNVIAKTLLTGDKHQWERDNPEDAGKAAGANQSIDLAELLSRAEEHRRINHAESMPIIEDPNAGEDKPG